MGFDGYQRDGKGKVEKWRGKSNMGSGNRGGRPKNLGVTQKISRKRKGMRWSTGKKGPMGKRMACHLKTRSYSEASKAARHRRKR